VPHRSEHSAADRVLLPTEAAEIAGAMSALAAESRVRLLYELLDRDRTVEELAAAVEMDASAVSQQLRVLRQLRFVVAEREGRHMRYRVHDDHVAELLVSVRHHHEHAMRGWASPILGREGRAPGHSPVSRSGRA